MSKEAKLARGIYDQLNAMADKLPYEEKMAIRLQTVAFPTMIKGLDAEGKAGNEFRKFFRNLAGVLRDELGVYFAGKDE